MTRRAVECDCGHRAVADDAAALVASAQAHARQAHRLELPAALVLLMAEPAPTPTDEGDEG